MKSLTPKQIKVLKWAGLPVFYLFCLVVFVRLTFPYDTLRARILSEFNSQRGDKRLEIDDLSGHWLFGIEAEGVRLTEPLTEPGDAPAIPLMLRLESVRISIAPFSMLIGNIGVSFDAEVGGGEIDGSFYQSDSEARIEVSGSEVDISGLTLLSKAIGLPLGGTLNGDVKLYLPERKMTQAEGSFDLMIEGLTVGDGKAKIRDTIALPKLQAGNLVLKAEAIDGRLDIQQFGSNGPDIEIAAEGKLRLRQPFDKSTANMDVAFRFKEAYTNKNDLTRSLFGSPDSKVPALFDMDPNVRRAKDSEGYYRWRVTGLLARPNFRPGQARSAAGPKR